MIKIKQLIKRKCFKKLVTNKENMIEAIPIPKESDSDRSVRLRKEEEAEEEEE